jgi:hypothetical protein
VAIDLQARPGVPGLTLTTLARSDLRARIDDRIRAADSREHIASALADLARGALDCGAIQTPSAPLHGLLGALDDSVEIATTTAIESLIRELSHVVDLLPDIALDAWERERLRATLGLE